MSKHRYKPIFGKHRKTANTTSRGPSPPASATGAASGSPRSRGARRGCPPGPATDLAPAASMSSEARGTMYYTPLNPPKCQSKLFEDSNRSGETKHLRFSIDALQDKRQKYRPMLVQFDFVVSASCQQTPAIDATTRLNVRAQTQILAMLTADFKVH